MPTAAQQYPEFPFKKAALLKYLLTRNPDEDYSKHTEFGCLLSGYLGSEVDDTFVIVAPNKKFVIPTWAKTVSRMEPRTFGAAARRLRAIMPVDIKAGDIKP